MSSQTGLTYQVAPNGQVVGVKTVEGTPYNLSQKRVGGKLPWGKRKVAGRWDKLKRAIINQGPGDWYIYEGFTSEDELKRAYGAVNRWKRDNFLKGSLGDKTLEYRKNDSLLQLAVRVVFPVRDINAI